MKFNLKGDAILTQWQRSSMNCRCLTLLQNRTWRGRSKLGRSGVSLQKSTSLKKMADKYKSGMFFCFLQEQPRNFLIAPCTYMDANLHELSGTLPGREFSDAPENGFTPEYTSFQSSETLGLAALKYQNPSKLRPFGLACRRVLVPVHFSLQIGLLSSQLVAVKWLHNI